MAKKITIGLTPAQARALLWAIDTFEASYEGFGDTDANRAIRTLEATYSNVAAYAYKD
jgi:hypothetical protein